MNYLLLPISFFIGLQLIFCSFSFSQHIQGHVKAALSHEPLEKVKLTIHETSIETYTESDGRFAFTLPNDFSNQSFELIASLKSYKDSRVKLNRTDSLLTINIWLEAYEAEEVVITATRTEKPAFETGLFVSKLTSKNLVENMPRSTPEALMGLPGVWVQKTNHGGGSPFVRGLTGNQVLIMVDGIRMNNSTFRYGPNQYLATVSPFSISGIEVVRGSGTVQYGTDAMGGAVNILWKEPSFSDQGTKFWSKANLKYMSGDMEKSGRIDLGFSSSRVAISAGLSYSDYGDLIAGGDLGTQAPSGYQQIDGDIKARFLIGKNHQLTVAHQQLDQRNVGRFDQVAQRGYAIWEFEKQYRSLSYLRWDSYFSNKWMKRIRLITSYQNSLERRRKQRQNQDIQSREEDLINTFGQVLEIQSQPSQSWSIVSGVEYYFDKIGSSAYTENLTSGETTDFPGLYPDGAAASNFGIFSLHTIQKRKWTLEAGLRYNIFSLNAFDEDAGELTIQPQFLVGNISSIFKLNDYNHLIASIHSGARAPNANDGLSEGFVDTGFEKQNPNLSPERSLTTELGYKLKQDRLEASLVIYHMQLFSLIDRVPTTYLGSETFQGEKVYQKENVGSAFIRGIETAFKYQFNRNWSSNASLNYAFGQNTSKDEPLRRIPPFNGSFSLRYEATKKFWSRMEWLFASKQEQLSGGDIDDHRIPDGGTPGWNVINFYAGYEIHKVVSIGAGLQNLLNEAYRTHGSGIDGYGRSFWLSLHVNL